MSGKSTNESSVSLVMGDGKECLFIQSQCARYMDTFLQLEQLLQQLHSILGPSDSMADCSGIRVDLVVISTRE